MWKRVFILFGLFLCALAVRAGSAWATAPDIELEGRYWVTSISGGVQVSGTDVNLRNDLKMCHIDAPDLRLTWHTGNNSWLRLSYTRLDYKGDNPDLSTPITFNGQTYNVNTHVSSSLNVDYASLGWAWQFINAGNVVKLGTLLSAKGFRTTTSLDDVSTGVSQSKTIDFGLPTVGAALDIIPVKFVDIFGEFSWMTAGSYGRLYDTEGGVKIIPVKYLSILGGYRIFDMVAKYHSDYADVKVQGPFVGATLRF